MAMVVYQRVVHNGPANMLPANMASWCSIKKGPLLWQFSSKTYFRQITIFCAKLFRKNATQNVLTQSNVQNNGNQTYFNSSQNISKPNAADV